MSLILATALLACLFYIHQQRQQLARNRHKISRLREKIISLESANDSEKASMHLLVSLPEPALILDQQGHVLASNDMAKALFPSLKNNPRKPSFVMCYRDPDWADTLTQVLENTNQHSASLPMIRLSRHILSPRVSRLNADHSLLTLLDITQQYRAQKSKEAFIANLMHDLKTPLTSLLGYARSIQSFGDNPEIRNEAAKVIADEAKHINTLLDTLLTIEHIEHQSKSKSQCQPADECQKVWQALNALMQEKDIQLKLNIDQPAPAMMDAADCYRVIQNIAENAVHYSPEHTTIRCHLNANRLVITDEGHGIPEKHLPRITERFYRGDASRKRGGHGLGLAITSEILHRDGGTLTFENGDTSGLIVTVDFPALSDV